MGAKPARLPICPNCVKIKALHFRGLALPDPCILRLRRNARWVDRRSQWQTQQYRAHTRERPYNSHDHETGRGKPSPLQNIFPFGPLLRSNIHEPIAALWVPRPLFTPMVGNVINPRFDGFLSSFEMTYGTEQIQHYTADTQHTGRADTWVRPYGRGRPVCLP